MKRIKNLQQWYKVPSGEALYYWGDIERAVEIELNTVGPCAVYVETLDLNRNPLERYFLGVAEGLETFQWRLEGDFAVVLDPSGEVWARRDQSPVSLPAPEGESFTRFEKAGLYVDEIGMALHRQAVLNRMAASQATGEERRTSKALEQRLADLTAQVAKLTAEKPPEKVAEPVPNLEVKEDKKDEKPSK